MSYSELFILTPPNVYNPIPIASTGEEAITSIGGFRKGEIDQKPFFIFTFTFLSQTDIPSSSSSVQPIFLCPSLRCKVELLKRNEERQYFVPFVTSPHLTNADLQVQNLLDSDIDDSICKLPLIPFFHEEDEGNLSCGVCQKEISHTSYYLCDTCGNEFHKECVESPLQIKHPSYPFQSLKLYGSPYGNMDCIACETSLHSMFYYCSTYKFSLHPVCAMTPIPIVINHPRRHPHPLTFFPKQVFLPCNVCGLIEVHFPTYLCLQSVFVVHQNCIYFPHVIRISRHHHRIHFTSSLSPGKWVCGVCRQEVDNQYGAYSCNSCDDYYFVHTRCALRKDLWDGEDLEEVPEEHDDVEVEPFRRIADGIIKHFSHLHYLKLEISRVYDEHKYCQACVLPIYEGNYYSCIDQCDFIFHEACANLPRKKYNVLHRHPLTLIVITKTSFKCDACDRTSCGFVYQCPKEECLFQLDVRCASVSEPFDYQGHEHPLFLSLKPDEERAATCHICNKGYEPYYDSRRKILNCIECNYVICFKCATLPYKARYKHDKHFLTFKDGKEGGDHSDWCDACETEVLESTKGGFYSCDDDCCTTLHIHCLFGKDPYMMKPGQTIKIVNLKKLHIVHNNTMSRPFCNGHEDRCQGKIVFTNKYVTLCSMSCIEKLMASLEENPERANFGFKTLWEIRNGVLTSVETGLVAHWGYECDIFMKSESDMYKTIRIIEEEEDTK